MGPAPIGVPRRYCRSPSAATTIGKSPMTRCEVSVASFTGAADQCHRGDTQLYGRLAGSILYANSSLRADVSVPHQEPPRPIRSVGLLISGDLPDRVAADWRPGQYRPGTPIGAGPCVLAPKGIGGGPGHLERRSCRLSAGPHEQIMGLIAAGHRSQRDGSTRGIFVRPADQISNEDRILIQTVARAILSDSRGALADQINSRGLGGVTVPRLTPIRTRRPESSPTAALPRHDLLFFNGLEDSPRMGASTS